MKIYLSGKITGNADYKKDFAEGRAALQAAGYEACDPAAFDFPDDVKWEEAMKYGIREMLECDGVALLPNRRGSRGSRVEARLARELGIPVMPILAWLNWKGRAPKEGGNA